MRLEVAELVRRVTGRNLGSGVARTIHARTAGNPFLIRELSRLLRGGGVLADDIARTGVPPTVHDIVRGCMADLDHGSRELLQFAAFIGRDVDLGLLGPVPDDPFCLAHELVRESTSRTPSSTPAWLTSLRSGPDRDEVDVHRLSTDAVYVPGKQRSPPVNEELVMTDAPSFSGLNHVAFTVRDLEASVAWYEKVFQAKVVDGKLPHYGREWTGYAELVIEPRTGLAIGLHHNVANQGEEFNEVRTGLDHISLNVEGREGLEAWSDWLDSLGVAHSGIQSTKEPFVYSVVVFRDIDNIQLEVFALGV